MEVCAKLLFLLNLWIFMMLELKTSPLVKFGLWLDFSMQEMCTMSYSRLIEEGSCRQFFAASSDRPDLKTLTLGGRTSIMTTILKAWLLLRMNYLFSSVDEFIKNDQRVTVDRTSRQFPQVSLTIFHEIVKDHGKIIARWVPRMSTVGHKKMRQTLPWFTL